MYLDFFNLKAEPFSITPDPHFLLLAPQYESAMESLLYGVRHRKGFMLLTGEVGTGKTTLCRELVGRLERDTDVSVILNPLLSVEGLLRAINNDFGNRVRMKAAEHQLEGMNKFLLSRAQLGRNAVVIIDEAQNLSIEALEMTRLLSNLETDSQKLLQVILVGQPELDLLLKDYRLRQLNQRISVRQHLGTLTRAEMHSYILHRLQVAGGRRSVDIDAGALRRIFAFSGGYPRLTNIVCDRIMLAAYARRTRVISKKIVNESIADLRGNASQSWWRSLSCRLF